MNLANRIKQLRYEKGFTQEELGEKIGVKKAAIQKYENGSVVNIKQDKLIKLANALGTTPSFLQWGLTEEKKINLYSQLTDYLVSESQSEYGNYDLDLINKIQLLNSMGKRKLLDYLNDLIEQPKYRIDLDPEENCLLGNITK